ncbi:MAG: bifunctional folylpolyglutamate synthase/dihydrofolate synthase [Thermodesulfovibrionales bacterium]|nr:bifunctional folylpolyglutamate synthase/dihydrofolate synthase [Thermodesulfovibrionales bacterium]
MDYHETVQFIYNLQRFGIKLGLQRIRTVLNLINNPHTTFHSIHVAGTNAKGSTCAMIHSMLKEAGFKVGLYTSPHLVNFTERIRIDNTEITEADVIDYSKHLMDVIKNNDVYGITFFEFVTALAFKYFKDKGVQCVVVETGMGGRLDATNVITPEVCVITPIGYDHKEYLGDSIEKIAYEKAGIIKPSIPLVVSNQTSEAMGVIVEKARENDSPVFIFGKDFYAKIIESYPNFTVFDFYGPINIQGVRLNLLGRHQVSNAATAIMAAYQYIIRHRIKINLEDVIRNGLSKTVWPGRLQWISRHPDILLDGAHNVQSAITLNDFISEHLSNRFRIFVIGIMDDKDKEGILAKILPIADKVIFTAPNYNRSAKPEHLKEISEGLGFFDVVITKDVKEALDTAYELVKKQEIETAHLVGGKDPVIVITGSLYLIGEAIEILHPHKNKAIYDCFKN